jgi:ADP-heptose:LPS heptosyltransferase
MRVMAMPIVWAFMIWRLRPGMRMLEAVGILSPARVGMSDRQRFLVVYLTKHLGDLVLLLPMIQALRASHPDACIEIAVQGTAVSLFQMLPEVDHVWGFDVPGGCAKDSMEALVLSWRITVQYLKLMADIPRPTVCVVPRWLEDGLRSGDLAYLTRAPRRVGFEMMSLSERLPFAERTLTERVSGGDNLREAAKAVYLLQCVGLLPNGDVGAISNRPVVGLKEIARQSDWHELSERLGVPVDADFAVIAPGATQARRRWPLERWAVVGQMLHDFGMVIVVLSGPDDAHIALDLNQALRSAAKGKSIVVAGITSIAETVTLVAHSRIYMGADSGPGHIAGGLAVPTVIQFIAAPGSDPNGGHSPERFRPAGPNVIAVAIPHTIPPCVGACSADCQHCILTIETEDMLKAVRMALGVAEPTVGSALA